MKGKEIVEILQAKSIAVCNPDLLEKDYTAAFASDLMSDALAMIQNSPETTVLITGLCNAQSLRTAEMLDIDMIVYVRSKSLMDGSIDIAQQMDGNIFTTSMTMYEACGHLYAAGLKGIHEHSS